MVGVPALHRVNAPTIADLETPHRDRLSEWGALGGGENAIVDRQFLAKFCQAGSKGDYILELRNLGIRHVMRMSRGMN